MLDNKQTKPDTIYLQTLKLDIMLFSAHIFTAGLIQVNTTPIVSRGFDVSGALAAYECKTIESLVATVNKCDRVERPNGKIERGDSYTVRKAKFDFQ